MDISITIKIDDLYERVENVCRKYIDADCSSFIAEKIVLAEDMNVPTHGLHYFVHSLLPHLKTNNINDTNFTVNNNIVYSEGNGGVGFCNLNNCIRKSSELARHHGLALGVLKNPGKIGALRVYCREIMDQGQLIIMMKNTARTFGTLNTGAPVLGTNPVCIGLPDTNFIFDSSMSTVATNKLRLYKKYGRDFDEPVGINAQKQYTANPSEITEEGGFLVPFSDGPFWYKSFFLAMAIEGIAAMAGGKTGERVGEHKGTRLFSREGMIVIIIDKSAFSHYNNYLDEINVLIGDVEKYGLKIPGNYKKKTEVSVLNQDWEELNNS